MGKGFLLLLEFLRNFPSELEHVMGREPLPSSETLEFEELDAKIRLADIDEVEAEWSSGCEREWRREDGGDGGGDGGGGGGGDGEGGGDTMFI